MLPPHFLGFAGWHRRGKYSSKPANHPKGLTAALTLGWLLDLQKAPPAWAPLGLFPVGIGRWPRPRYCYGARRGHIPLVSLGQPTETRLAFALLLCAG